MIAPATPDRTMDRFAALHLVDMAAPDVAHRVERAEVHLRYLDDSRAFYARARRACDVAEMAYQRDEIAWHETEAEALIAGHPELALARAHSTDLADLIRDLRAGQAAGASTPHHENRGHEGMSSRPPRAQGVVRMWNDTKGFGFITPDAEGEKDAFVHYSAIQGRGRKSLAPGDRVEYDPVSTEKGMAAGQVVRIGGAT